MRIKFFQTVSKALSKRFQRILIGLVVLVVSHFALSASVIPMTLKKMVLESDHIVVGRCIEVESRWQGDQIVTDNVIAVEQLVKGEASSQLLITTLGGNAQHPRLKTLVNMDVPGGVSFQVGEEVLVFAKESPSGMNHVVALSQGKYLLEQDDASGERVIAVGQTVLSNQDEEGRPGSEFFSPHVEFQSSDAVISVSKIKLNGFVTKIQGYLAE